MYIAPNSTIKLLKNVPLDSTYNHTLFWYTQAEQQAYFSSCAKYTLEQQSYQRYAKGTMRIALNADLLYDCNYLMFQNTAYGNKWFYAFIKEIEYVSNGACQVTYVLDVMQTWFFDFTLQQCFVEREHTQNDAIGANTVPEGLEQGPYYVDTWGYWGTSPTLRDNICIVTTFDIDDIDNPAPAGRMVNGVFSSLFYKFYDRSNAGVLKNVIAEIIEKNKQDGIVAIYMVPFGDEAAGAYLHNIESSTTKARGTFNGYTPKNNKLYCYPYNILHVYTNSASADFRYENFSTSNCGFGIMTGVCPEPAVVIQPIDYDGNGGNNENRLTITGYPQCGFASDVYKSYVAANANALPVKMIGMGISAAANLINAGAGVATMIATRGASGTGSVASGLSGLVNTGLQAATFMAQIEDIKTKPPQFNGAQAGPVDFAQNIMLPQFKKLKIKGEYARIIDNYFTMYGYATRRVKVPNLDVRERWCYTKTVGCVVKGNVPSDDLNYICRIFDNGITFWKNPSEVGNYSLSNLPEVG